MKDDKETGRVESFSDAVFAFAITLLALNLVIPALKDPTQASLAAALRDEMLPLLAFVLSFATVLIMWTSHHRLFGLAHHLSWRLLFANGLLLMLVALCPVPTAILAESLGTSAGRLAAAVYAGYFVLVNVAFNLLFEAIVRAPHAEQHAFRDESIPVRRARLRFGFYAYVVAAAVAWFSPWITVAICAGLWGYWARPPHFEKRHDVAGHGG